MLTLVSDDALRIPCRFAARRLEQNRIAGRRRTDRGWLLGVAAADLSRHTIEMRAVRGCRINDELALYFACLSLKYRSAAWYALADGALDDVRFFRAASVAALQKHPLAAAVVARRTK